MSGSRGGPSTYTFRISSEGMQEFVQELSRLSAGSEQANAAIGRLVQSSPQLASALTTAQDATARAAQRATELRLAQERGAAVAEATVVPMRRASDALGNLESKALAARRATADFRGALELLGAGGLSASLGPVSGAVGGLADLFGTASLAAGNLGSAAATVGRFLGPVAIALGVAAAATMDWGAASERVGNALATMGGRAYDMQVATNAYAGAVQSLIGFLETAADRERRLAQESRNRAADNALPRLSELGEQRGAARRRVESLQPIADQVALARQVAGEDTVLPGNIQRRLADYRQALSDLRQIEQQYNEIEGRIRDLRDVPFNSPGSLPQPAPAREPAVRPAPAARDAAAPREFAELRGQAEADALAAETIRARLSANAQREREQTERAEGQSLRRREQEAERSSERVSQFLSDDLTDAFLNGERGFEGMLASIQRTALATPIRIATEAVITPAVKAGFGALGGAGEAGGIASLFGFTEAGGNALSLLGLGGEAGGGIAGLLGTPLGASLGSTATIGSALGGIGGGFALGSLVGGFTAGDSRARQQNSQIGAGGGAVAGAVIGSIVPGVGTVLGGLIGGAIGGGGGGLLGPGRGFSGGDALIGVNDNGALTVAGYAGKNFEDSSQLLAQAQQQVASLNGALELLGLRFAAGASPEGGFVAAIGGGESDNPRGLLSALTGAGVSTLRAADPRVQAGLDRLYAAGGGSLEAQIAAANEAAGFAAQIDAIAQAAKDAVDPIGAIRRSFEEQFRLAERLGFGYETLAEAQQKAIDAAEAQQKAIDAAEAQRRVVDASAADALARGVVTRGILDDLTVGGIGGLAPAAQATAARLRLAEARGALSDGATTAELEDLRRVAGQTLPLIQRVEGITQEFAALVRGVTADALAASPGADSAGLSGVIDATNGIGDQISNMINFAGGATVAEIRALRDEIGRLAIRLDAQQARQAA